MKKIKFAYEGMEGILSDVLRGLYAPDEYIREGEFALYGEVADHYASFPLFFYWKEGQKIRCIIEGVEVESLVIPQSYREFVFITSGAMMDIMVSNDDENQLLNPDWEKWQCEGKFTLFGFEDQ